MNRKTPSRLSTRAGPAELKPQTAAVRAAPPARLAGCCLEQHDLLPHILASYELRNSYHDYCPPVHLQQLKKALVSREEFDRVAEILKQFPARRFSLERIETLSKKLRRYPREEARAVALRFAEDFMRLRRDLRNYERLATPWSASSSCAANAPANSRG